MGRERNGSAPLAKVLLRCRWGFWQSPILAAGNRVPAGSAHTDVSPLIWRWGTGRTLPRGGLASPLAQSLTHPTRSRCVSIPHTEGGRGMSLPSCPPPPAARVRCLGSSQDQNPSPAEKQDQTRKKAPWIPARCGCPPPAAPTSQLRPNTPDTTETEAPSTAPPAPSLGLTCPRGDRGPAAPAVARPASTTRLHHARRPGARRSVITAPSA